MTSTRNGTPAKFPTLNVDSLGEPSTADDLENKKRFVKHLNPEYKANIVYQGMVSNPKEYPDIPRVGHAKRIFLRKLIREAKKGKLDKFFLK